MNKVIYTAIFGGYDDVVEPTFKPDGWDFVCFTDTDLKSDFWEIRKVLPLYKDSTRNARRYKVLPHHWFPKHEISCWIDGNAQVRNDINELLDYIQDCHFATFDHSQCHLDPRGCVYDEANAIISAGNRNTQNRPNEVPFDNPFHHYQDDPNLILNQMKKYQSDNYPSKHGLLSSMVLLRRHNENDCVKVMEDWWTEIKYGSKRDQLSFNYSAWKNDFKFNYFKGDVRNNKHFLHMGRHKKKRVKN